MTITHYSEFSGLGGTDDGARFVGTGFGDKFVPWIQTTDAANHDPDACHQHALNFPEARHYQEDVTKLDMEKMPRVDLFTASPACPAWTDANGVKRDFDKANAVQAALPGMEDAKPDDPKLRKRIEQYKRSRLLMNEVPKYLRAMIVRDPDNPVLIGMVENVIQCRLWSEWDVWINEIKALGYHVKVIAYNSMHARPVRAPWAGQSRNRLFVGIWHRKLGRHPDWDKWLRPKAYCENCCEAVDAIQQFKKPGADMGSYESQYVYRCPKATCRGKRVYPETVPALSAIDMTKRGVRIGDRPKLGMKPLAEATMGRISAGRDKIWGPLLVPVGGTWRGDGNKGAVSLMRPAPARTTRETDGLAFITPLRGGGCRNSARPVSEPAGAVTASGNHHGLAVHPAAFLMRNNTSRAGESRCTSVNEPARTVTASGPYQSLLTWDNALVVACAARIPTRSASEPTGTLTTRDRFGLALAPGESLTKLPDLDDIEFRMLEDDEIGRLMGFGAHFRNEAKSKRTRVRLYGNAVVPSVAELIVSALVECLSGEELPRDTYELAA